MQTPSNKIGLILDDIAYILSPQYSHAQRHRLVFDYLRLRVKASLNRWFHFSREHFLSYSVEVPDYETFFAIFRQIFVRHAYYFKANTSSPTIIDCGGNIGMSVLYYKYLYPEATIIVFEPSREVLGILRNNIARNALTSVTVVPAAVSSHAGKMQIHTRGAAACGNTLVGGTVNSHSNKGVSDSYEVDVVRLSNHVTGAIDALKLDIEGSEGVVIRELEQSGKLQQIHKIVMEYHYNPSNNENDLIPILQTFKNRGWETQFFFEEPKNNFSLALENGGEYPLSLATVERAK
jgi:FkbM family methyltransferase